MSKQTLLARYDEYYRSNRQVWNAVMMLSPEQFIDDTSYTFGTVHNLLVEMIATENLWINYLWHDEVEFLHEARFPSRAAIRQEWDALEEEILDYIDEISPIELEQEVDPSFIKGRKPIRTEDILLQVIEKNNLRRMMLINYLQEVSKTVVDHPTHQDCYVFRKRDGSWFMLPDRETLD